MNLFRFISDLSLADTHVALTPAEFDEYVQRNLDLCKGCHLAGNPLLQVLMFFFSLRIFCITITRDGSLLFICWDQQYRS